MKLQSKLPRVGAALAPLGLVAFLSTPSSAQQRTPSPLPPSVDVKTAPEASHVDGTAPARPPFDRDRVPPPVRNQGCAPRSVANAHAIDRSTVDYAPARDGSLWARGARYKASFGAAGATYYPAL